jgi:hypothetical protein
MVFQISVFQETSPTDCCMHSSPSQPRAQLRFPIHMILRVTRWAVRRVTSEILVLNCPHSVQTLRNFEWWWWYAVFIKPFPCTIQNNGIKYVFHTINNEEYCRVWLICSTVIGSECERVDIHILWLLVGSSKRNKLLWRLYLKQELKCLLCWSNNTL